MEKKLKIYYVKYIWPPFWLPYHAITIPPIGIFIKEEHRNNQKIMNHEMVHWEQYLRLGLLKFYFKYLKEFLIFGYQKMPMEIEARHEEN